ncbi:MAG: DUF6273 domain-containing protein, partial [Eubacteriales bacterium]|nr:DUF6273 domain-containing protein [Eubacteriales bacterium]
MKEKRNMKQRLLSMLLAVMMICTMVQLPEKEVKAETAISNPRIVADSSMAAGQKVTWDCVWFGNYPQTQVTSEDSVYSTLTSLKNWDSRSVATVGNQQYYRQNIVTATSVGPAYSYRYYKYEPIKWRVLNVGANNWLLVANKVIDTCCYDQDLYVTNWSESLLRTEMNEKMYSKMFDEDQKTAITGTQIGDKLFLLTKERLTNSDYGFEVDDSKISDSRAAKCTDYCKYSNLYYDESDKSGIKVDSVTGNCRYWVYDGGVGGTYPHHPLVSYDGTIKNAAEDDKNVGVRPVIWFKPMDNVYSYAGTVCSDGTANEVGQPGSGSSNPEEQPTEIIMDNDEEAKINEDVPISAELKSSSFVPTSTNMTWHLEYNNDAGSDDITIGKMSIVDSGEGSYIISSIFNFKKAGEYEVTLKSDDGASATIVVTVKS